MSITYSQYKVVEVDSLYYRESPSVNSKIVGTLKKGDKCQILDGYSKTVTEKEKSTGKTKTVTWYKLKSNTKHFYISSKYLKKVTPNYLVLNAAAADKVYKTILDVECKHKSGATTLAEIKSKKITTCAISASVTMQEAGILKPGKILSHTNAVGSSVAVSKKNTIDKAMNGESNLIAGTYKIVKIGKKYKAMDATYKQKGIVYIQDSNVCVNAGDDQIYSCNNAASELKNGIYVKNKLSSGYCFTSPILYAIVPKS